CHICHSHLLPSDFFCHHPTPTEFYTLSLHDALPICVSSRKFHSPNLDAVADCGKRSSAGSYNYFFFTTSAFAQRSWAPRCSLAGLIVNCVTTAPMKPMVWPSPATIRMLLNHWRLIDCSMLSFSWVSTSRTR